MNLRLIKILLLVFWSAAIGTLFWSAALGTLLWFLFLGIIFLINVFRPL